MKNLQLIIIFTILSFSLKAQTSHGICDSLFLSNTTFFLTNTDSVFQFSFNYLSSLGVGYGIYRFSFDDTTYVGTTYHSSRNLQDVIRICGTQKGFKSDKAVIDFLVYFYHTKNIMPDNYFVKGKLMFDSNIDSTCVIPLVFYFKNSKTKH